MDEKRIDELTHHGIKGQKWGVRRFQNKDGSLTKRGKKRYEKELAKAKEDQKIIKNFERTKAKLDKLEALKKENAEKRQELGLKKRKKNNDTPTKKSVGPVKSVKDLSDEELATIVRRAQLEQQYNNLNPKKISAGEKMLKSLIIPTLNGPIRNVANEFIAKKGKEFLGLSEKKEEDPLKKLRDDVNRMNLEKQYKDLTSDDPLKQLKEDVNRMNLEKQYKELSSYDPSDAKLSKDVTRMTLEKRREELLKEREKK